MLGEGHPACWDGILGPTKQLKRESVIVDELIAEHSGRAAPDPRPVRQSSVSVLVRLSATRRLSWPALKSATVHGPRFRETGDWLQETGRMETGEWRMELA